LQQYALLRYFVVERAKTARAHLKQLNIAVPISELDIRELNEHSPLNIIDDLIKPIIAGQDCGLMSEAGVPAVADPGAELVAAAHIHHIEVVPGVGASSILLTLMASGLNGQRFAFEGYLPAERASRDLALKNLESRSKQLKQSIFWIETPYRAQALFEAAKNCLNLGTRLTVACDVSLPEQMIRTYKIEQWRTTALNIEKRLTVFGLMA
jgi:16S rRNA (cytidine1402-2'-O)-methyltransferase